MKKLLILVASLSFLFLAFGAYAQELTIGLQIRPRGEFRNGFKTLTIEDRDPAFFVEQRSRLWTDFKTDKFRVHLNIQDVRIWGQTAQIYKADPNLFNIYEGWGEYYFDDKFSFRIGRMALDYNNARFLGNLDWAQQGRSHDALLFIYNNRESKLQAHVGLSWNQSNVPAEPTRLSGTLYTGIGNYKTMQFAWLKKNYEKTDISFLFQNDGRQVVGADTSVAFRQTYATIINHNASNFSTGGELFYQGGKNGRDTKISAFMLALYFTYKTKLTPITVGIDYLSGTSINDGKDKSFDPLYGTNHKFYGYMDYFYVGNFHGQAASTSGLSNIFVKTNFKLGKTVSLNAHYHLFNSAADIFDPADVSQSVGKYLGSEVDLVLVIKPAQYVKIDLGYSQMFASSSMEAIKSTPGDHTALNNWAWFMIDFNPVLFKKDFSESSN